MCQYYDNHCIEKRHLQDIISNYSWWNWIRYKLWTILFIARPHHDNDLCPRRVVKVLDNVDYGDQGRNDEAESHNEAPEGRPN